MKVSAVIVAAGKGLRMGGDIPKQYLELAGLPVLGHTLLAFEKSCVDDIFIVCPLGDEAYIANDIVGYLGIKKVRDILPGGNERFDSSYIGICAAAVNEPDYIMIHDGVRALITPELIDKIAAAQHQAAVLGVPVKDTLRVVGPDGQACGTPDRSTMCAVQTPQCFGRKLLMSAYIQFRAESDASGVTDDAMLIERYTQEKVFVLEGSYENIKITTPEDMLLAEAIIKKRGQ